MAHEVNASGSESSSGNSKLLFAPLTQQIIKCFYDVYNELGGGFLESVYSASMAIGLNVQREVKIPTRIPVGLVLNFGLKPQFRRAAFTHSHNPRSSAKSAADSL
jgi:PD-(D/E)XK nuclease superfamily